MKCVYYVTNVSITAYRWQANTVTDAVRFNNTPEGLSQVTEWATQHANFQTSILCDVIEEEFTQIQMPNISRGDFKLVMQRKLKHAFRDTPYRLSRKQSADNANKNSINVTFSAITNPDLISGLLKVLAQLKIPVDGIYSPACLTSLLLSKVKCESQYNLLISQQDNNHMRLSFVDYTELKSSRLSNIDYDTGQAYYLQVRDQIIKNQRYLKRMQLLPQTEDPTVYVIGEAGLEEECQKVFTEQFQDNYQYIPIHELCEATGLRNSIRANQADMLFVQLLCSNRTLKNYAPPIDKKYYYLNNANKLLKVATLAGIILGASSSIYNVLAGLQHTVSGDQALKNQSALNQVLTHTKKSLPHSNVSASEMRALVYAGRELRAIKTDPGFLMVSISKMLETFRNIDVDELSWKNTNQLPPQLRKGEQTQDENDGNPRKPFLLVKIKGHIAKFNGNFPSAQRQIRSLMDQMRKTGQYSEVHAIKMPVNTNSNSSISGNSGSSQDDFRAEFTVILIKRSKDNKS